jgi:hypothetical protein
MTSRRFIPVTSLFSTLVVAAACASSGGTSGGGAQTQQGAGTPRQGTTIEILNNAPGAATVTVYMVPEFGVDTPLGPLDGGETRTFAFDGPPGYYRIKVVGPSGESLSDRFQLFRNSSVRWDMSAGRRVRVGGRGG